MVRFIVIYQQMRGDVLLNTFFHYFVYFVNIVFIKNPLSVFYFLMTLSSADALATNYTNNTLD